MGTSPQYLRGWRGGAFEKAPLQGPLTLGRGSMSKRREAGFHSPFQEAST